ncbi:Gfo/Idh/MocA family protein [Halobellus inordinatus]|uniref:Gfo/Idh/MocA family protein n=1 Tax=Halobellus inordinatus TaxID=1126236 RepID=UPI002114FD76|nr:Gfo/Idh/MocA family oxidoreductase [Halobellus ramosii]
MNEGTPVVAVLGAGLWGRNLLRIFDEVANVQWCLHAGSEETDQWLQKTYPAVKVTTEYEDILEDASVDAVVVATPNPTHVEFAEQALRADKHVFVEKPLATVGESPTTIIELADYRNLTLFVGYVFLYHPVFDKLRAWDNEFVLIRHDWQKTGSFGVNVVENLVCHEIAVSHHLLGVISDVYVHDAWGRRDRTDVLTVELRFENGARSVVHTNRLSPTKQKIVTLLDEAGNVLAWDGDQLFVLDNDAEQFELQFEATEEPLKREANAFLRAMRSGGEVRSDGAFGVCVNDVVATVRDRTVSYCE